MQHPYLPDIIQNLVSRVDAAFAGRAVDKFNVFFDKGNYAQAWRDNYQFTGSNPLVWLAMPFSSARGKNNDYYADTTFTLWVVMPTDNTFTQQQRDDFTIKPRLLPVYDVLLQEIEREGWFSFTKSFTPEHTMVVLPYWGMGTANGTDADNFFGSKYDAIKLVDIKCNMNFENCRSSYQPLQLPVYPTAKGTLTFFKDIELIVDGGRPYDPIAGQSSVIIPDLLGFYFEVSGRVTGQLRQTRDMELAIDTVNGGFALLNGYKFSKDDTYIISVRPTFIPLGMATGTLLKPINKPI